MELHPDQPPNGIAVDIPSRIPHRNQKVIPDLAVLRAGDVLLFRVLSEKLTTGTERKKDKCISKLISSAQSTAGYSDVCSSYSHSAIYLGVNGMMCEANFDGFSEHGVGTTSLLTYCDGKHAIKVRRLKTLLADGDAKIEEKRWTVAIASMTAIGRDYDFGYLFDAWKRVHSPKWFSVSPWSRSVRDDALVCSEVCASAYSYALSLDLHENGLIMPATLAASDLFTDIKVDWKSIPLDGP